MKTISFEEALDIRLVDRQIKMASNGGKRPETMSRREMEAALLEAFELVGGVPRLAIWANNPENYGDFLKLAAKLLPKEEGEAKGKVVYQSAIPASPLNKGQSVTHQEEADE